jgi:membrane protein implicated in regulation of membrane protease activity
MDWLNDYGWSLWLGAAVLLGAAEMFSLDLILGMLAVGALAGFVAAVGTGSFVLAFVVAIITSVGMLALVRPGLVARLHTGPDLQLGHGKLVGQQGVVTETVTALAPGRIRLAGEIWTAQPYDENITIAPGETVEVFEIRGATAYVHPIPRLES